MSAAVINRVILLITVMLGSFAGLANKPDLFLLKTYDDSKEVVGWVMSEKLDGVRGFWNGQELLTRGGYKLNPPLWFVQQYPPFAVDGELWTKRDDFENVSSIVRTQLPDDRWKQITHNIFEVPNQPGGLLKRLDVLRSYLDKNPNSNIQIIPQTQINCQDSAC